MACFCTHGNKRSGSTKGTEVLKCLSNYELLKKESVPWSWLVSGCINIYSYNITNFK